MTDKQIIINGVDISKCKHYDEEFNYCDQSYLGEGGLLKNTKNPKRCECSPNCYYKQLKRKEQECENNKIAHQMELDIYNQECLNLQEELKAKEEEFEELKKDLRRSFKEKDTLHLIIDRLLEASGYDINTASEEDFEDVYEHMRYGQQQLDQLKAELEQEKALKETYLTCYKTKHEELFDKYETLKVRCKSLEDISGRLQEQNHNLTLENEKLEQYKASKQASYEALQERCNKLELENRKLKAENEDLKKSILQECPNCGEEYLNYKGVELYYEIDDLKQTLTEIKEIAKSYNDMSGNCMIVNFFKDMNKILQKCNEVLDE